MRFEIYSHFGEDQFSLRKDNAPQVMAVIRHLALNLLQLKKNINPKQSIKKLRNMADCAYTALLSILRLKFSWGGHKIWAQAS
jgi:hypothetical protein